MERGTEYHQPGAEYAQRGAEYGTGEYTQPGAEYAQRGARYAVRGSRNRGRGTGYGARGTIYGIRATRHAVSVTGSGYGVLGAGCGETWSTEREMRHDMHPTECSLSGKRCGARATDKGVCRTVNGLLEQHWQGPRGTAAWSTEHGDTVRVYEASPCRRILSTGCGIRGTGDTGYGIGGPGQGYGIGGTG